ncbi:hypothetical protein [Falsirhodobacter sp. 20TX0035]|uniref:hypothetical protein n=1 Tax=Falsirhodobacter sp. 20TX0035 TaxID=3022019 RepID=UPI00232A8D5B|nr:hypothetical protein [Falsirhodobacter sp. 20TX0035]MDB6453373.1 hypothetical protein [Falsirhodobacter sp. 20TX0035]
MTVTTQSFVARNVTYVVSGAKSSRLTQDDVLVLVPAVATAGITVHSVSPPTARDEFGRVLNGAEVNPLGDGMHGLDQRAAGSATMGTFDATRLATFPVTLKAGDNLLKSVGVPGPIVGTPTAASPYGARRGVVAQYSALEVTDALPPARAFAPPVVRTTRKAAFPLLDLAGVVSRLPALPGGGVSVDVAFLVERISRFNPVIGKTTRTNVDGGYETLTPFDSGDCETNYGRNLGNVINTAMMLICTDIPTLAEKTALVRGLISLGIQWDGPEIGADGGHWQFVLGPILLKRKAFGQGIEDLATKRVGNWPEQYFAHTAETLRYAYEPHDDPFRSSITRRRVVDAVDGLSISLPFMRQYTAQGWKGDQTRLCVGGLELVRERDGARATVTARHPGTLGANETCVRPEMIDAQPAIPFAKGDVVFMRPKFQLQVGDPDWLIVNDGKNNNCINPALDADYRSLNQPAGLVWALHALGLFHPAWRPWKDYVDRVAGGAYPAAGMCYPTVFHGFRNDTKPIAALWSQHWPSLRAKV